MKRNKFNLKKCTLIFSLMAFLSFPSLSLADEVIEPVSSDLVTQEHLTPASDNKENETFAEKEKSLSEEVAPVVNRLTSGETTNKEEANGELIEEEDQPSEEKVLGEKEDTDQNKSESTTNEATYAQKVEKRKSY